ncbi:MAG: hypothetical protein KDB25_02520, partial [Leucobacter sp.]|nr:hypothetical protein [Leucobacter sp.]
GGAPSAGSAPSAGGAPSAGAPGQAHYRASAPAPSRGTATGAQPLRRGDRIATILLLVLGAFGALYSATTLQQLPASLSMLASALDITDFVVPDAIPTLGTVGGLLVLAVYALAVVLSIQRLRRGSLSFWVPLAAAAIAFLITFAFTAFALNQAPELVQHLADPDAMTKLLDYLGGLEGAR